MHKFDKEFDEFFENPDIKKLLEENDVGEDSLIALKNEEERLWDVERYKVFYQSIIENPQIFAGKVVLVLRPGLGLPVIWAAKAGAERVICADDTKLIDFVRELVKKENLNNVDCIYTGTSNLLLGKDMVDVIISDWIGYFGVNQKFIYELIRIRDMCLKKDGVVLPDKIVFSAGFFSDEEQLMTNFGFWDKVYDYQMPVMKNACFLEAVYERVTPKSIVTAPKILWTFNLAPDAPEDEYVNLDNLSFNKKIILSPNANVVTINELVPGKITAIFVT
ncbi:unnamed protein product [Rotaria magnacalcarata]|uniref:Uncharacterized protein n=1 Tax=Rotaria magnacalcarata TaxID=392030 RepID=A0A819RWV1_9BILA|nr:unnamed protein product [Rotaria magnacalcarata]CAF4053740.1 unnamed protein product [Rotaria magnacalcarata]